jgi:hypothetical protein
LDAAPIEVGVPSSLVNSISAIDERGELDPHAEAKTKAIAPIKPLKILIQR